MNEQNKQIILDIDASDEEIPAWKLVDLTCRKWAALSGLEKDLSDYQKRKDLYE